MSKWKDIEKIENFIKNNYSYSNVLREMDLAPRGDNFVTLKNFINENKISVEHFVINTPSNYKMLNISKEERSVADVFKLNSNSKSQLLREKISKYNLIEYKCAIVKCGNKGEWLGKKVTLALDHINGIWHDNRIENLRFLCPNCHAQTDTYVGKNSSKEKRIKFQKENDNAVVGRGKLNFQQLINEDREKVEDINYLAQEEFYVNKTLVNKESLQKELLEKSVNQLAEKYKCSGRALLKACLKRGFFIPASHISGYWVKLINNKVKKIIFEDLVNDKGVYKRI